MGATFDTGFTIDRIGGTVAMALLEVMLQGMIALEETRALDASGASKQAIENPAGA